MRLCSMIDGGQRTKTLSLIHISTSAVPRALASSLSSPLSLSPRSSPKMCIRDSFQHPQDPYTKMLLGAAPSLLHPKLGE